MIVIFAAVLGSLATQHDSADAAYYEPGESDSPAYIYMDFGSGLPDDGLKEQFMNPVSRPSVVEYLTKRVGDPVIADALVEAADRHHLDPSLVVAVSWQESRFRVDATGVNTNKSIDRGLMQLNSSTFTSLDEEDFFNPYINADHGASYLKSTLKLSGNTVAALAMYNAGPGRVRTLGAPRKTLDYISAVFAYRDNLIRGYHEEYGADGVLVSRDLKPLKNPDLL